jgi:hypothetical protein
VNGKRREEGAFTENKFLIKKIILLFKKFTHNSAQDVFECEADEEIFARSPGLSGEGLMNNLFGFLYVLYF